MKDVAKKARRLALGVALGAAGCIAVVYMLAFEWALLKHLSELTKDDTWSELALRTMLAIIFTVGLFKVEWWLLDKMVLYSRKALVSFIR